MSELIDYQQSSFNAGELSPLVKGREGLEKFGSGLKQCENALVLAHGPVTARGGLRYIGEVKDSSKEVKLVPFEFNEDQAYVLEMGDEYMRVWMDGGQVVTPDTDTSLLLHMNGDDGDIDFTDKSQNTHVITANGNAQVDTDDPLMGSGNLLLDGSGDHLSTPDHTSFDYGTDELTIDFWFYTDVITGQASYYFQGDSGGHYTFINLWVDFDTNEIYFADNTQAGNGQVKFTYSTGFAIDTWYHLALIRGWGGGANDWMVTINGLACGSLQNNSITMSDLDGDIQIGEAHDQSVPDHSKWNHRLVNYGNVKASKTHFKLGNGSLCFDGTGDYFSITDHAEFDIEDAGALHPNFTLDMWIRPSNTSTAIWVQQYQDASNNWSFYYDTTNGTRFYIKLSGGLIVDLYDGNYLSPNVWHHVAIVKVGTKYGIYVDGALTKYLNDASMTQFSGNLFIGVSGIAGSFFTGYMDDIRLGHSNYFDVDPEYPFQDDGDTGHVIYTNGEVNCVPTEFQLGDGSGYFDGAGDRLMIASHADWDVLIQTNVTIEMWVKHDSPTSVETYLIHEEGVSTFWQFLIDHNGMGGGLDFAVDDGGIWWNDLKSPWDLSDVPGATTDWHHVAMVKVGNNWATFIDGKQIGFARYVSTYDFNGPLYAGSRSSGGNPFAGYMDEILIHHSNLHGVDPVAFVEDDGNTGHTAFPYQSTNEYRGGVRPDYVTKKWGVSSFVPWSAGHLQVPDHADWDITSQTDMTLDFWFYQNNPTLNQENPIGQYEDSSNSWQIQSYSGIWSFAFKSVGVSEILMSSPTYFVGGVWRHMALVKVGNEWGLYMDGDLITNISSAFADTFAGPLCILAGDSAGATDINGYMDEIRLCHNNPFGVNPRDWIDDSSDNDNDATAYRQTTQSGGYAFPDSLYAKWGTHSYSFDGGYGNLLVPTSTDFDIKTNWTLDLWVRHTDHAGTETYISHYEDSNNFWKLWRNDIDYIGFMVRSGGSYIVNFYGDTDITDSAWHHLAICKVGDEYGMYLDGVQIAYLSDSDIDDFVGDLRIASTGAPGNYYDGRMDDIRIYEGNPFSAAPNVGKTDTITEPTGAHTSDSNTKLLLQCEHTTLTVPTGEHTSDADTKLLLHANGTEFTPPATEYTSDADTKLLIHANLPLTPPTEKRIADTSTGLLLRGDVQDDDGGIDEYRVSTKTRWTEPFTVNVQEYPGAGGGVPYELLTTPWAEDEVSALKYAGVGDILYVVHPDVAVYKISRTDHEVWTCEVVKWVGPPWKEMNDTAITLTSAVFTVGTARALAASAALFTSSHIGAYFKFNDGWGIITAVADSENATWDIKDALTGAGPTADWYMSAWSKVDGFPSCITFYEDRLCLSGAAGEPTKVRFSETGDYENMTVGVADSDPMAYQILSQKYNKILWLVGGKKLFIGTAGAEVWMSGAGVNTPLTPTSVLARRESTIGSQDIQPVTIGSSLMFIQRAGRTVNLWKYEYINDSFEATDLGILAEHLMKDYSIADIQYAQDPDHIAWILRTDGTLLGLTHMRDHDVTGWHKHYTSDKNSAGDIETFAVIPGTSQGVAMDELWMVAKRTIDGATARYIEMLTPRFGNFALPYAMQTDSCISYIGSPAIEFSGADHLEGELINILADGKVFNTTVTNGGFTLATAASVVTAGLPYTVTIEFLVALLTELVKGVTTAKRKRIVELLVMMYQTCQLNYGVDAAHMFDLWNAAGLTDDTLNDEYVKVEVDGNPEYEPTLMLKQIYPYPFTLLGVVETIEVEEA